MSPSKAAADAVTQTGVTNHSAMTGGHLPAELPVFGIEDYRFNLIHVLAVVSLGISLAVSSSVFGYLHKNGGAIWKKSIGERLTIYLAACDVLFNVTHICDHGAMLVIRYHPPDLPCVIMAYFLTTFILAQSLLVSFTAINAFLLVVKEIKLSLGRYDWKLLLGSFGIPASITVVLAGFRLLGPSGAWCFVDMRKPSGPLLTTIISGGLTTTFLANLICYMLVWRKIQRVTKATAAMGSSTSQSAKYAGTARVLMLFVAAYIGQWWPYVVQSLWSIIEDPPIVVITLGVLIINMGGVFNFIAYTFVRVLMRQAAEKEKAAAKLEKSNAGSQNTVSSGI